MTQQNPNLPQNLVPNEPELKDLLDLFKKEIFLGLNCHAIGTVQSFNSEQQTASATINYKKTFYRPDATGVYTQKVVNYPQLIDCPVICVGGGGGSLTFPITSGDECFIFFNDRDLDNWFQGNRNATVATPRLHSFSDAVILVGVRSLPHVITDYDTDGTAFRFGSNKIKISADKITASVANGTTVEIDNLGKIKITNPTGEFIASLLDMLTTALTNTILGPQPLVFDPALLAIVESFKAV